jgi:glycosyltransferase involved in cell wall biosynthesis
VIETLDNAAEGAGAARSATPASLPGIRVQIVDPPAWTRPYDHALSTALGRAGADVELVTTEFPLSTAPPNGDYRLSKYFYRRSARLYDWKRRRGATAAVRRGMKLAEHVPDLIAYRRHAATADIVHYQWLAYPPLDVHLLPSGPPLVYTSHNVLPREPRRGEVAAIRRLLGKLDAVIVHSEDGARRLREELGAPPERVHVIPHGAFDYLTELPDERPLGDELAAVEGPVVLFFGLLRSYKGLDVLIDAFKGIDDAELWIVGLPHIPLSELESRARRAGARVRFVPRFVGDDEIPALFRRADIVALPYREIDQSGVLQTALAFGRPLVLSRVGGFTEVGEDHAAARLVEPGDVDDLHQALTELLGDPAARGRLGDAALRAAAGPYSWDAVAERTLRLYQSLLER